MTKKVIKTEKVKTKKEEPKGTVFAVGRRKSAIAQVRLTRGNGEIKINNKTFKEFFPYFEFQQIILAPFKAVGESEKYDIQSKIIGGGKHGQAEAMRLAIARALLKIDFSFRQPLKSLGFLTRDARIKERKKPGLKRARRAPQWQKR
jgi:small subunit ribosomal protein S9